MRADKKLLYATALSAFCLAVLSARLMYVGQKEYVFLTKNLFLAWMPYAIAWLILKTKERTHLLKKIFLFTSWMLFFPNSAYILTDIYHLEEYPSVPQWYDLLMLLSFSWAGITWGFYSLHLVQQRFFAKRSSALNVLFVITVFFAAGVGIYLGRYERWNSWDVLLNSSYLFERSKQILTDPQLLQVMLGMGILFCGLLGFMYYKFFSHNFNK